MKNHDHDNNNLLFAPTYLHQGYRLLKLIGKGGFCNTYLAVDEGEFPPVPCVIQQLFAENQTPAAFVQKAQLLEELGQHPQIPAILAHFQDNQYFYLVQEFITGTNLATLLAEQGSFSETQIWQLLESILPVIKFISDRHLIHRNIKPENIILKSPHLVHERLGGEIVLVDFGAAIITSPITQLMGENIIGSPEYIAPEQAQGKPVFASDLYSLGVTCIHLLTQIPPFDLFDIANDCWVWQEYLTTKISHRLMQILNKLLQKSLIHRFHTADEVMEAMGITYTHAYPATKSKSITDGKLSQPKQLWQCLHTIKINSSISAGSNALAFSHDGHILASGDDDKIIRLWELNTKKLLTSLKGHTQAVKCVAFSPNGQILATASDDKTIKLWNIKTFSEICTLWGHTNAVKSVAFSPDGQMLASGSWDKTVKLWDVNSFQEICTLSGHQLQVTSVTFSPQGEVLASASFDRTVRLWHSQRELNNRPDYTLSGILSGHAWAVLTVAFSPDGKILATGSEDNTIKLWDVNTGQVITTLSGHSWSVVALAFTADGEMLISASWDQTVKLWRVTNPAEIATLSGHIDSVSAIAVSQVRQLIASAGRDKTIKIWKSAEC